MKRLSEQTLYEILEIPPDAAPSDIEAACERARALYAPGSIATYSLVSEEEAALLASRIEEAGRTLLDPEARARYDAELSERAAQAEEAAKRRNGHARPRRRLGPPPPVIPALRPAEPGPEADAACAFDPEVPAASPSELLASAAGAGGPADERPRPILLEREISPEAARAAGLGAWPEGARPASTAPDARPRIALTQVVEDEPPPAATPPPPAAPRDVPMPAGSVWTGEALRKVREARGISLQQIAERTKVTRHHVENIEADRFASLPAPVYLRGILLSLARELRLDGQRVARSYLERVAAARSGQGAP